jgi:tetraacyldisaccharide 4'-kinase
MSGHEILERYFLSVIISEREGRFPTFLRAILKALSKVYGSVVSIRHLLYEYGIFRYHTLGCQVISIGNLTVGGTGKTPIVEIFARALSKEKRSVAILSRGYKKKEDNLLEQLFNLITARKKKKPPRVVSNGKELLLDEELSGDEPFMLASNLPDVCVVVDKDRVKSGRYAIDQLGCDTLILDDGFQYRRLKHRVEIVLVDCTNPFSNGYLLPRGLLREDINQLKRADFIFITKATSVAHAEPLKQKIRAINPRAEISICTHSSKYLKDVYTSEHFELSYINTKKVGIVSGIASPAGFETEIRRLGATIVYNKRFADHHRYTQQEVIDIINKSRRNGAQLIITTEKDAVRLPKLDRCDIPLLFLRVEIELLGGEEDFNACISRICFK